MNQNEPKQRATGGLRGPANPPRSDAENAVSPWLEAAIRDALVTESGASPLATARASRQSRAAVEAWARTRRASRTSGDGRRGLGARMARLPWRAYAVAGVAAGLVAFVGWFAQFDDPATSPAPLAVSPHPDRRSNGWWLDPIQTGAGEPAGRLADASDASDVDAVALAIVGGLDATDRIGVGRLDAARLSLDRLRDLRRQTLDATADVSTDPFLDVWQTLDAADWLDFGV